MSKTTKTIAETLESTFNTTESTKLFNKGLERIVEASKATLDLAAAQNADILAAIKKAAKPAQVPEFVFDLAGQAIAGQVSLQKNLLDVFVAQSLSLTEASQEMVQEPAKAQAGLSKLIQQSVDRTVSAQDSVLEYAAAQSKAVSETLKQQPNVAGSPVETVADSIQRGVETAIATQKEMLANAAKASKNAVAKA
jgi:hypothetical protein